MATFFVRFWLNLLFLLLFLLIPQIEPAHSRIPSPLVESQSALAQDAWSPFTDLPCEANNFHSLVFIVLAPLFWRPLTLIASITALLNLYQTYIPSILIILIKLFCLSIFLIVDRNQHEARFLGQTLWLQGVTPEQLCLLRHAILIVLGIRCRCATWKSINLIIYDCWGLHLRIRDLAHWLLKLLEERLLALLVVFEKIVGLRELVELSLHDAHQICYYVLVCFIGLWIALSRCVGKVTYADFWYLLLFLLKNRVFREAWDAWPLLQPLSGDRYCVRSLQSNWPGGRVTHWAWVLQLLWLLESEALLVFSHLQLWWLVAHAIGGFGRYSRAWWSSCQALLVQLNFFALLQAAILLWPLLARDVASTRTHWWLSLQEFVFITLDDLGHVKLGPCLKVLINRLA